MQKAGLRGSRLSIQQAHLWDLQRDTQTYWVQCVVSLEGEIQREALRLACEDVILRHEILRTVFCCLPGMDAPFQMVNDEAELVFDEGDLRYLDTLSQQHYVEEMLLNLRKQQSDLAQGPVVHVSLLQRAEKQAFLLLSLPALCGDIPTLKHFITEMTAAYVARIQAIPSLSEDDTLQYADVSAWQNDILKEEDAHLRQSFWAQTDLARIASVRLPFGSISSSQISEKEFVPQRLAVQPSPAISSAILNAVEQTGVSPEAFLLSCWQLLLWRLTGEGGNLLGVACDGRLYEDLENALGLYTRFVPLSFYFDTENIFSEMLAQTQNALKQAKNAQIYFNWDYLYKTQHGSLPGNFIPLSFEFASWPAELAVSGLRVTLVRYFGCTERFVLKLAIHQSADVLHWEFYYDAAYMQPEQVQRVADSFLVLLEAAAHQPHSMMSRLPLLDQEEQKQLLQAFRGPECSYPARTLQQLFEEQVEKHATFLAVICGNQSLTYEQLNTQANRLAFWLKRHGVKRDVPVCLCLDRSVEMLIGLLAVLKAGGAYVPLDPDCPQSRLAFQFEDTQAPVLLTQEHLLSRLPAFAGQIFCLDRDAALWLHEDAVNPSPEEDADSLAYIIYTSGSTGVPKGVQIRQSSVVNYTCDMRARVSPTSGLHFATVSTLAADLGNTAIFSALASGGCLHILSYETMASGEAFADYIGQQPVDVLKIVPSHLQALLASSNGRAIFPRRYLVLGGETLLASFLRKIHQRGAQCAIINHYGPTETTIGALVNELGVFQADKQLSVAYAEQGSIPVGYPISNMQVCIVDQHRQIVPVGVIGEVLISGAGLAAGYLHQPELTGERFQPHPFSPDLLVYKTGDLACYTADGKIEFVGRADRQVKLRGYRIELGEIEATLRRYPHLREAVVVLRDEEAVEKRLVAYVVSEQETVLVDDDIRVFLEKTLPVYMVPAAIIQIPLLPLTMNGKLDYQALPAPEQAARSSHTPYVAPRSPIEEVLVTIWRDVLQSSQKIGIYDNFFLLGGHSLLVTQVISRLKATLQVNVPIVSLFENATIASLVEQVEGELSNDLRQRVPLLEPVAHDR